MSLAASSKTWHWDCGVCTFKNTYQPPKCEICGTLKSMVAEETIQMQRKMYAELKHEHKLLMQRCQQLEADNLRLRQQHPKQQVQRDVVDTSTNFTTAVANVVDLTNDSTSVAQSSDIVSMTQKRSRTSRYRSMSSIPHPPHSSISHLTQCPPIPLHRYHHVTTKLDVYLHLVPSSTGVVRRLRASPGNDSTRHAVMQLTAMHQNSCLSYTYEACS